ncbi:MAG: twin-arginine translocase subunit TatC, partial [Coriobacteriia bacterium]|nr:twin-arginine translocase subunit TatC [Coriobacteriia bacterium]
VFYLVLFDIVPYAKLRANWRVAYIVMMVVASVATPDWSPVTMGALFAALVVLYEASLLLARVLLSKRIRAQRELDD